MRKHETIISATCDFCFKEMSSFDIKQEATITIAGNSIENNIQIGPIYQGGKFDICSVCLDKIRKMRQKQ